MIYEFRAYHVMPGKKRALLDRFETTTMRLFERHGIRVVGFWETEVGNSSEVVYLCAYADWPARERAWAAFRADPEWLEAVRTSEADGPLVARVENRMWNPVPFAPLP